jgi:hypothetical protein
MLTFYVLNVGHGSSIVVECNTKAGQRFGVIDSNARADEVPRALIKLRQLGASSLSFIALTHPHKDHFSGLYSIIRAFHGNIDQFYSCPFGDLLHNRSRLKSLAKGLKRIVRETDGMEERRAALELMQIIKWADEMASSGVLEWRECKGEEFSIAPEGFSPIDIATIQPPSRVIGDYVSRIMKEDMRVLGHFNDNEISLAFRFAFRDKVVILGGDGTATNWEVRRRHEERSRRALSAQAVNLPHHGSKYDCTPEVLCQLFAPVGQRFGVTSADGISHPNIEVIEWLEANGVAPFCTNLIPECGANVQKLLALPGIDPELARWVREVARTSEVQPCQGDVVIAIDDGGAISVVPEHNHPCGYRGDYRRLFGNL